MVASNGGAPASSMGANTRHATSAGWTGNAACVCGGEQVEELFILVRGEADVGRRVWAGDDRINGGHGG